jgi:hypothetical protein
MQAKRCIMRRPKIPPFAAGSNVQRTPMVFWVTRWREKSQ